MRPHLAIAAFLLAAPGVATAQTTSDEIVVSAHRQGRIDLKRLAAAESAFEAQRDQYAPGSRLEFLLKRGEDRLRGYHLMLVDGDRSVPVPVSADGLFTLPEHGSGTWELWHDAGRGKVVVRARVRSPGATDIDAPLGDFRLMCRVNYELLKPDLNVFMRAGFATIGGCNSRSFGFNFQVPQALSAAVVDAGGRTVPLSVHGRSFRAPLGDKRLPNSARVRLTPAGA
jgi:hypothetical protein